MIGILPGEPDRKRIVLEQLRLHSHDFYSDDPRWAVHKGWTIAQPVGPTRALTALLAFLANQATISTDPNVLHGTVWPQLRSGLVLVPQEDTPEPPRTVTLTVAWRPLDVIAGLVLWSPAALAVRASEGLPATVERFFRGLLGREPDPAGVAGWVAFIEGTTAQGGDGLGQALLGFIHSPEYSIRMGHDHATPAPTMNHGDAVNGVTTLFRACLGVDPTGPQIDGYLALPEWAVSQTIPNPDHELWEQAQTPPPSPDSE